MVDFLFLENKEVVEILSSVLNALPDNSELYLIGGSIRNGVFHHFFQKHLPQRDFDLVYFGDSEKFQKNLLKLGFEKGIIQREFQKVFFKNVYDSKYLTFEGVYLDIHFEKKQDLKKMLEENVNFTFQGILLEYKYLFQKNWFEKIIYTDEAIKDLKKKQIKVNKKKKNIYDSTFYSCLRFISLGFKPPNVEDLKFLVDKLHTLKDERLERNKKKVINYVGGKEELDKLLNKLKIEGDIFSRDLIKNKKIQILK